MNKEIKILYNDDEEINVQLFNIVFSEDYQVLTGSNGNEGLAILNLHPDIDVIISDMKMPEMNGLEFISIVKEKFPNKKYYLLTGYGINPEIKQAIDSELIINCFSKPFNKDLIENEIISSTNNG